MNKNIPMQCDVVIIGGGPAGSSAATLLTKNGYDVVLLEKALHPRATVGESLLPHAWRFFDLLGVTKTIEEENFVVKQGGTIVWDDKIRQLSFSKFGFTRPGLHVERDRLDHVLLMHSQKSGAKVFENITVKKVNFGNDLQEVVYQEKEATSEQTIKCKFVVDASGQAAVLSRQFNSRVIDEDFRFVALWAYHNNSSFVAADGKVYPFSEVRKTPPTTFVGSLGNWGWSWHIPLKSNTSVGVILPIDRYKTEKKPEESIDDFYTRTLTQVPYLSKLLSTGEQIPNSLNVIRDYSYMPGKLAGPGYFITGDAAAFVDPIFSLGVVLGLYSGQMAAWAIDRIFRDPSKLESSQEIYRKQFNGRYELARAMALPGRKISEDDINTANQFLKFQSNSEQELMYTAAMLTTRSANFNSISPDFDRSRLSDKYRDLEAIQF